ncbi:MAG: hypothetical protein K2L02_00970 [Clostridia bacterium]|nr:hypothetical protein [Clostridia bacterium]
MSRKIHDPASSETVETKAKRIAISATVAGVLLIVFLVVILIVQFVKIGVKNAEKSRLEDTIEKYEKLSEKTEKDLEYFKTEDGLRMLAVLNNWKKNPSGK